MPRIIYTNGATEYWGRDAALIHVTPDGKSDAEIPANVRVYTQASTAHGPGAFPPRRNQTRYLGNPTDFRPFQRAVLAALHGWVKDGVEPPASRYPKIAAGELVAREQLKFPKLSGVDVPQRPKVAWRVDYGPAFVTEGVVSFEPPNLGKPFPVLVPQVDKDGLELGGIRQLEAAVPAGVATGWNLRAASMGAPGELALLAGGFFPFTPAQLKQRYGTMEAYMTKAAGAADQLIRERFLLPEDRQRVLDGARVMWDAVAAGQVK